MPRQAPPTIPFGALLLALASVAPACRDEESGPGRGMLVIAVDAWRAAPLEGPGLETGEVRRFRRFVNQGVQFRSAWSTAPEMLAAHATLLTGCDPRLGQPPVELFDRPSPAETEWFLSGDVPRVAEAFLAAGWRTAAFVDDVRLGGRSGLDQGFQLFEDPGQALRYRGQFDPYGIDGVARRFHDWLRARDTDERWFAYLQLADLDRMWKNLDGELGASTEPLPGADDPVLPVADASAVFFAVSRRRFDGQPRSLREYQACYVLARARLEKRLDGLFTALDKLGWSELTTIVLVGSHGFGFGESGLVLDSGTLSDVDLNVPLVVQPSRPSGLAGSRIVDELVSTMDVAPTLLDLAGVPRLEGMHGQSLLPLLEGGSVPVRDVAFASSDAVGGWAAIDARYCFEHVDFDVGPISLASSWHGIDRPNREEQAFLRSTVREHLHDRAVDSRYGHLGAGSPDSEAAARLRSAGEEWNALVLRARLVLHDPGATATPERAQEVAELRKRRMLGRLWGVGDEAAEVER